MLRTSGRGGKHFQPFAPWPSTGLHLPVPVDRAGLSGPTPGQARGPRWRRVGYNAYVPVTSEPVTSEQRILDATAFLPPGAAITGWGALRLAGAAYFDGFRTRTPEPVWLALGAVSGRRKHPNLKLSYERLEASDVTMLHGVPCTIPSRALFDELRRPNFRRLGVIALDLAVASGAVSLPEVEEYAASHRSFRRARQVDWALRHADPAARSPQEVRTRLVCRLDFGLWPLMSNQPVFDHHGNLVCIPDLLDVEAGLVIEYDGAAHLEGERRHRDVTRDAACRGVGLEYATVTALDFRDLRSLERRLKAARSRALFLPHAQRQWTLSVPPGWRLPWSA